jgi:hypothetical protein
VVFNIFFIGFFFSFFPCFLLPSFLLCLSFLCLYLRFSLGGYFLLVNSLIRGTMLKDNVKRLC